MHGHSTSKPRKVEGWEKKKDNMRQRAKKEIMLRSATYGRTLRLSGRRRCMLAMQAEEPPSSPTRCLPCHRLLLVHCTIDLSSRALAASVKINDRHMQAGEAMRAKIREEGQDPCMAHNTSMEKLDEIHSPEENQPMHADRLYVSARPRLA